MVTVKGFIRSYSAAVRRSERTHQRRAREAARQFKLQQKIQEIANNEQAVYDYKEYIEVLKSVHIDCSDSVDWQSLKNEKRPTEPVPVNHKETLAIQKLKKYTPSFIDRLFGLEPGKRRKLEKAIIQGKEEDQKQYKKELEAWEKDLEEWQKIQNICNGLEQKSPSSYKEAIQLFNPFQQIGEFGSKLSISFEPEYAIISLYVKGDEVIPNYILSQTASGKLSKKNMPVSKFNELYQDYVCSCVLRIAREAFTCLPLKFVVVNAIGELLNPSTGHIEDQIILSVLVPPATLEKINFESIDPSDSMKNFLHNMKFSKTNGFTPVKEVKHSEIEI